nr:poly-gamma-glutamate hydrolase family protein [Variovorax boronicumulans]
MTRPTPQAKNFHSFAELAAENVEGVDYRIKLEQRTGAKVAVVAPHGGLIEEFTSEIATGIAGAEFSLYLFEGCRQSENYAALHLTSHYFDEPACLKLVSTCDEVLTVHGCRGDDPVVLLGGLDKVLTAQIAGSLTRAGLQNFTEGHRFPATHPKNICNRGRNGMGVQMELSHGFRESFQLREKLVTAVRTALLQREEK